MGSYHHCAIRLFDGLLHPHVMRIYESGTGSFDPVPYIFCRMSAELGIPVHDPVLVYHQLDLLAVGHALEDFQLVAFVVIQKGEGNAAIVVRIEVLDQSGFVLTPCVGLKVDPEVVEEIVQLGLGVIGFVYGDQNDGHVGRIVFLHSDQIGEFFLAGAAPGGKEIHQNIGPICLIDQFEKLFLVQVGFRLRGIYTFTTTSAMFLPTTVQKYK